MIKKLFKNQMVLFGTFFAIVVVLSFFVYKDFGISTDEPIQSDHLRVAGKKIFSTLGLLEYAPQAIKDAPDIQNYPHRFYGVAAQYPLLALEFFPDTFNTSTPAYWQVRHLYTRLLFVLAGFCMLLIFKKFTNSKLIIFVGLLLFFLHPRISAHSFFNIKDSVFLSFFTFSMYFLFRYIDKPSTKNLVFLGLISAITVNVRMMGLLIPGFLSLYLVFSRVKKPEGRFNVFKFLQSESFKSFLSAAFIYSIVFVATLFLIWPSLWGSPLSTFNDAFNLFKKYDHWSGSVLFNGVKIPGSNLPFYYIPVWIGITSPLVHLFLWVAGLLLPITYFLGAKKYFPKAYIPVGAWIFIVGTYSLLVIMNSVLYGGWRHVQYLFAPLVVLGVYFLDFARRKFARPIYFSLLIMVFASLLNTARWMIVNHPFHYVYFNDLAGKNWDKKWDVDYWGISGRQLIGWLLENGDPDMEMRVSSSPWGDWNTRWNLALVPLAKRKDFSVVDFSSGEPNYNFSYYKNSSADLVLDGYEELYSIRVDGKKISTIFVRY